MFVCSRCAWPANLQTITPVTTGAVIAHEEPVREITAYVKIFVTLSQDHELDPLWNSLCSRLEAHIREHINKTDWRYTNIHRLADPLMEKFCLSVAGLPELRNQDRREDSLILLEI